MASHWWTAKHHCSSFSHPIIRTKQENMMKRKLMCWDKDMEFTYQLPSWAKLTVLYYSNVVCCLLPAEQWELKANYKHLITSPPLPEAVQGNRQWGLLWFHNTLSLPPSMITQLQMGPSHRKASSVKASCGAQHITIGKLIWWFGLRKCFFLFFCCKAGRRQKSVCVIRKYHANLFIFLLRIFWGTRMKSY